MRGWIWKTVMLTVFGGVACSFLAYRFWPSSDTNGQSWKMAEVRQDELLVTIAATGTLEPEEVVDVGAQVAGKIQEFGIDPVVKKPVDYGTEVEAGTVLAQIDPAIYEQEVNFSQAQLAKAKAHLAQSQAAVKSADAAVERSQADLAQMKVKLALAERDFQRSQRLTDSKVITQELFDTQQANLDTARAALSSGEAALAQSKAAVATAHATEEEARADVQSAEASLKRAQQNLDYTTIRSPIKGIVIDRRVNIGQTVVASLNAPSLFLIAKDLRRLQVWAAVNEADIGRLKEGQRVTFQVDAFPGQVFTGAVRQIRLNASMTQNVVTYTVVVDVANEGNKLLPYLTANVKFEVNHLQDVFVVPNAALSWKPRREQIAPELRDEKPPRSAVWVRNGSYARPIAVTVGDTDGTQTAISGDGLVAGLEVIAGETRRESRDAVVNPLLPQMQGKKKGA